MIIWFALLILFSFGLFAAYFLGKRWFVTLFSVLAVGAVDLAVHLYLGTQKNCGALYDQDVGCMQILPSWLIILGLGALFLATTLSVIFIVVALFKLILKK